MEVKGQRPTYQPYTVAMVTACTADVEQVITSIRQLPIQHLLKSHTHSTTCIYRTSNLHSVTRTKNSGITGQHGSTTQPLGTVGLVKQVQRK